MDVADLRQTTPEPEALALIPDAMAREHFVIPMKLDEVGLHVAMADQPSPELLTLLSETSGTSIRPMLAPLSEIRRAIDNNYRAIGGLDHLVQAFEAVESTRRRTVDTATTTRRGRSTTTRRSSRSSAAFSPRPCVTGPPTSTSSRPRAGIRVRYRIDGALKAGADAPRIHGRRPDQPDQDHGRHEHRRAPPTAGRPAAHGDRRQRGRRPGGHGRHHLGREVRDAAARPDALRPPSG